MEEKRNVKKRILITVVILFLIQLLAGIPTPGVNLNYFKSLLEQNTTAGYAMQLKSCSHLLSGIIQGS